VKSSSNQRGRVHRSHARAASERTMAAAAAPSAAERDRLCANPPMPYPKPLFKAQAPESRSPRNAWFR
jgi:hypothetical protein